MNELEALKEKYAYLDNPNVIETVFKAGFHAGIEEEGVGCFEHCEKAREEGFKAGQTTGRTVNRIEVIDHTPVDDEEDDLERGRVFVKWVDLLFKVEFVDQDEGRTLKVFIKEVRTGEL